MVFNSLKKLSTNGNASISDSHSSEKSRPPEESTTDRGAPPSYTPNDLPHPANEPTSEELDAAFSNLNISATPTAFPTPEHCFAHLKLLSLFHNLKEDIGYTDGLFNLWDARCEVVENRDEILAKMREKRWALYLARAVERFEAWWLTVLCQMEPSQRLECKEMLADKYEFADFPQSGRSLEWTTFMLPPIDVLMVWHSFMLNPRCYEEDCVRFGLRNLWATGMPWSAVNAAIDTSFNYHVPEQAMADFAAKTGHEWNNADDPLIKKLHCPRCTQLLDLPWTNCCQSEKPSADEVQEMAGNGYGDRELNQTCQKCLGLISRDTLLIAKFKKDAENLIMRDWPMGGTILDPKTGKTDAPDAKKWPTNFTTFPNRLIRTELRSKIIELLVVDTSSNPTMNDVKEIIETAIKDKHLVKRVNGSTAIRLRSTERLAIRKMMSRYWANKSIFALELGGAVIRQGVFVDKMHSIDWLHSPAARSTMNRLLQKYSRFINIIATNPLFTAVPTLDVDLGWHTHQLSPASYYGYTMKECKKFIDHDDKIAEDALSSGFEWTSKTYQKLYNEVYSECTCWYCEAIRSKHIPNTKVFGTSSHEKILNNFYDSGAAKLCPPDNSAHISAHNAVRVEESATRAAVHAALHKRRQDELENAYVKACKRAEAKGRAIPPREQHHHAAWQYQYMMYGPYMAVGATGVYYAGDPCTMPMGPGMPGACAAGTCSGGVAAGGCGGPGGCGSAGCGVATGGCGGSAGSGGGGGCGGGGA